LTFLWNIFVPATPPYDTALKALAKLVAKHPNVEGEVIWAQEGTWQPQDDDAATLDGEEIPYYAEGMLMEGYRFSWQALGENTPEFIRLFFWQGACPALPSDPDILASMVYDPAARA
jgi:hypothetical protein